MVFVDNFGSQFVPRICDESAVCCVVNLNTDSNLFLFIDPVSRCYVLDYFCED